MTDHRSEKKGPPGQPGPESGDYSTFAGKVLIAMIISAGGLLVFLLLWVMSDIFLLVFGAVLVTLFIRALSERLKKFAKLPDSVSVAVVILALMGGSYLCIRFLAPHVGAQIEELSMKLPEAVGHLQDQIRANPLGGEIMDRMLNLRESLKENTLFLEVKSFFSVTFGVITDVVIFFFISLYLCFQPGVYIRGFLRLVPARQRDRTGQVIDNIAGTLRRWLIGRIFSMTLVGLLTGAGLWILGVPLALTLGLLATLLTFIPYLGAVISAVPAVLLGLLIHPNMALYVIGLYLFIHALEAYLLSPLVQQRQVFLPPAIIITVQIALGYSTGLLGLALATPLAAVGMVLVKMLYIEDTLGDYEDARTLSTQNAE